MLRDKVFLGRSSSAVGSCLVGPRARSRSSLRQQTCCLGTGVVVKSEPVAENKVKLEVEIDGKATRKAFNTAVKELSSSIAFPTFRTGTKNAPLPASLVTKVLGQQKVTHYAVDSLIVDVICDHASETGYKLRSDLKAADAVQDIDALRAEFQAGQPLTFTAQCDVIPADYQAPVSPG